MRLSTDVIPPMQISGGITCAVVPGDVYDRRSLTRRNRSPSKEYAGCLILLTVNLNGQAGEPSREQTIAKLLIASELQVTDNDFQKLSRIVNHYHIAFATS